MSSDNSQALERGVSVWNDSGGVDKTVTTVNTACALGRTGADVLVIDLDPQFGSLTDHVGLDGVLKNPRYSITDPLLSEHRTLDELVIDGEVIGVSWDLIPSNEGLEKFAPRLRESMAPTESLSLQLRNAIADAGLPSQYEYLLIDCPATRGPLVRNAVAATLNVLIPTSLSRKGVRAVDGIIEFVNKTERELEQQGALPPDSSTGVTGVIPNGCAKTGHLTTDEQGALRHLVSQYGSYLPGFYVPDRTVVDNAWSHQQSVFGFADATNTRQLRPNEEVLLEIYEYVARAIRAGSVTQAGSSPVQNIPAEVYPELEEPTTPEVPATTRGGPQ